MDNVRLKLTHFVSIIILIAFSFNVNATLIVVEASGTGTYKDFVTNRTLNDAVITQTWMFDTDDVPAESYGGTSTTKATHLLTNDWITATISVNGGIVGDESSVLDEPVDHAQDIIVLWDDWGGWDQYKIESYGDDYSGEYDSFFSTAYFRDYIDNVIIGLEVAQSFDWVTNHTSDIAVGHAFWYDRNDSAYNPYARVDYNITSMRSYVANVPEPSSLVLFMVGVIGVGIRRRQARGIRNRA